MISEDDSLKKSVLHYSKCQQGNLHYGEVMSIVCVDAKCQRRGLICPVCRMELHQDHQILPVKIFLDQIKQLFQATGGTDQLNNLSDYLRSLQYSRKQLLNTLKDTAMQIAQSFQTLQKRINENYTSLRRSVLTQSTISTKLPNLVNLLTEATQKNPAQLQMQFQRYVQLLKYENDKIKVSDKSKKLVEEYAQIPIKLKAALQTKLTQIKQKLNTLPVQLNQQQIKEDSKQKYTFSPTNKSSFITIDQTQKIAKSIQGCSDGQVVFVSEGKGKPQQKITLQIIRNSSNTIHFGMGIVQDFKPNNFVYDHQNKFPNHEMVISGGTYHSNDQQLSQESESIVAGGFCFDQTQRIQIRYNSQKNTITFKKLMNNQQKIIVLTPQQQKQKNKFQFVVGLGQSDQVRIIDQK